MENLVMNNTFWQKKKVLITGHTGFKGSWLSLWLQSLGANVIGFALPPATTPNLFTIARIADSMTNLFGDIRESLGINQAIQQYQPEIIIHMAAQSLVRYSYDNPLETYATNVMGTINLLEAARKSEHVRVIINVTTDKCYENKEWPWGYRENDRLGGLDPYSNSKACSELVTSAYRHSYFNPQASKKHISLASARAGNVIGGGDWAADRLIPDIIRNWLDNKTAVNIRSPNALRPWQHVLEPLNAYLLLAQHMYENPLNFAEAWNFGPEEQDAKSVKWIVNFLANFLANGSTWLIDGQPHYHEAHYLKLDSSKAKQKLGWRPCWHLEKSLIETVYWFQAYNRNQNMQAFTLQQINAFTQHFLQPFSSVLKENSTSLI